MDVAMKAAVLNGMDSRAAGTKDAVSKVVGASTGIAALKVTAPAVARRAVEADSTAEVDHPTVEADHTEVADPTVVDDAN
jgi:hypothetical protein